MKQLHLFNQKPILEVLKPISESRYVVYESSRKHALVWTTETHNIKDFNLERYAKLLQKTDSFSRKNTAVNTAEICEK